MPLLQSHFTIYILCIFSMYTVIIFFMCDARDGTMGDFVTVIFLFI